MISRSIYMRDISKHPGPRAIHQITARCYSRDSPSPRCGRHDPSYHKTHTFTSSGKVASKLDWTKQPSFHWNACSSPFFPFLKKTSLQATHFCHFSSVPTKERWANQLCYYIFIPRIFFLQSTDRFSHLFFSRFHCDCGFLSIAFCLSVH